MKPFRRILLALGLTLLGGLARAEQPAVAIALNIPAQPMPNALNAFAQQTGLQVIFPVEEVRAGGAEAPQVIGTYTPTAGLELLLAHSNLRYAFVNSRTVAIRLATPSEADTEKQISGNPIEAADRPLTLAQAEPASAEGGSDAQSAPAEDTGLKLEEVVVTGTHIRGRENNTAPVIVLDRADIDATGFSTTSRLIESLPQNFALTTQSGTLIPGTSAPRTQGSSINLRGIGEGTTLVLLNGRRMASGLFGTAVDISALPLSAVERVEILTDGASALYGSDAVGGVVNFILRKDFQGAETRLRAGAADGVDEYRVSQALGTVWDSGNALLSLEYYRRDLLEARERDFVPSTSIIGSLLPRDKNHSAMFSGRQQLTQRLSVFVDALYTQRDTYNESGRVTIRENYTIDNPQVTATAGLTASIGGDWQMEFAGSYARNHLDQTQQSDDNGADGAFLLDSRFAIKALQIKADGTLFELPTGKVRMAVGADWRSETFDSLSTRASGVLNSEVSQKQTARSAFGEAYVPIVDAENARAGVERLELSLAGRFDDYSNFGSSFDPRIGFMWEPHGGLRVRGSYGTSYVAPKLSDYNVGENQAAAFFFPDPTAPGELLRLLEVQGKVRDLSAQESKSWSVGVELTPVAMPDLKLGLNYYDIEYTGRIAFPPSSDIILGNPASFASLIARPPTAGQVAAAIAAGQQGFGFFDCINDPNCALNPDDFDPATVDVLVDGRKRNLSATSTSGLDASLRYGFRAADADIVLELAGTYIFELEQQITSASAPFDSVDTIFNPPDWRVRGSLAWQRRSWQANLFVNHTDSYTDNSIVIAPQPVASYTTVDARVAYDFKERFDAGFFSGVTLSASAQNVFDRNPPHTAVIDIDRDMGFDPTNANPLGRLISIEVAKTW